MTNIERLLKVCAGLAVVALCASSINLAEAGTILKLSLGSDAAADVSFDGTTLSTVDDGVGGSPGDQNTAVEFTGFLAYMAPIPTAVASFTLDGVTVSGTADVGGGVVSQSFLGGSLSLYDAANALLLAGTLDESQLVGPVGGTATGAVFTTSFGSITGGTLSPQLVTDSLSMSMAMTDVDGGAGLSVTGSDLDPFQADAVIGIGANQRPIPEPSTATLAVLGAVLLGLARRPAVVSGRHG